MRHFAGAAIATIQDHPSIAAGTCAFAVAFALVAGNALFGQPGRHPDPIWATRDRVTTQSVAGRGTEIPVRKVRTETVVPVHVPVPSLRPAEAGHEAPVSVLVRDTQEALAALGVYDGAIDGLYGPKTREAVLQFQRANGLEADGEIDRQLRDAVREFSLASSDTRSTIAEIASRDRVLTARVELASSEAPAASRSAAPAAGSLEEVARAAMIARIQIGLLNFGEAGISVDGVLGPRTAAAIRAFQERYDLAVTGEPGEEVVRKLEQIGALQKRS